MAAEQEGRNRRSGRYASTPDRVSDAARRAQQEAAWRQNAEQQAQQQEFLRYQAEQQQAYARQMQAQQEYARQQYSRMQSTAERQRVSSQTASHGAFRGYSQPQQAFPGPQGRNTTRKKNTLLKPVLLSLVILAVLVGGFFVVRGRMEERERQEAAEALKAAVTKYDNLFCEGVYVDDIHLGGMTQEQAMNNVESRIRQRNDGWKVELTYQGEKLETIDAGKLGMVVDVYDVMKEAWAKGHTGDYNQRLQEMEALKQDEYRAYTAQPGGNTSVIDNLMENLKRRIDVNPQDAYLAAIDSTQPYPFVFQQEVIGKRLDTSALRERLYRMVSTMESGTVELQPETLLPSVLLVDLQKHYMLRSSVYTPISTSSEENRNNNIRKAFEKINGYELNPGKDFSFNGVVGQRTTANGFFPATEYVYGEHAEGVGGGVCQASSTVYQAAVCAGLRIIKREPHSDRVNYTEYGKDATVYWVGKRKIDLVFRNNTSGPIYLFAAVQTDPSNKSRLIAKVTIYGEDMGDVRYEMETETVSVLDPPLIPEYTDDKKSVAKAREGYVIDSYRVEYVKNVRGERVFLYRDTYKARAEKIWSGKTE